MAHHSRVPKFGNWENEENVPYTMYFDKARKGRTGGKMINPNDPQENPDLFSDYEAQAPAPPSKIKAEPERPLEQEAVRTTYESRRNKEDGVLRQFRDPPARHEDMSSRAATESTHQRGGRVASSGETYKKSARNSMGSDNSFEHSPLHNHARTPARGGVDSSSPSWEGKSVYRNSQGTPGRSRMRPNPRGDESPDKGAAVPKFGDWDENNPSSADGFTHIFNKVREERNTAGRAVMPSPSPQRNYHRPASNDSVKSCCFPWGKK